MKVEPIESTVDYLKILLYGEPGVGKSIFAGSAVQIESMKDIAYADAEKGMISIKRHFGDQSNGIDRFPINRYKDMADTYEWLRRHLQVWAQFDAGKATAEQIAQVNGLVGVSAETRYRTVIIDSLTEIHKFGMYHLLGIDMTRQSLQEAPDQPQFKEWGQAGEWVKLMVRSFRDLPVHFIAITGEIDKSTVVGDQELLVKRPNLPGKLPNDILHHFDVVGYMQSGRNNQGESIRRMRLQPRANVYAKNRLAGQEIASIDNPSLIDLLKVCGMA